MFKKREKHLSEEAKNGAELLLVFLLFILVMLLLNYFMSRNSTVLTTDKEKEKTIIITEAKQGDKSRKQLPEAVVSTVRDAIKQGNYSTIYMNVNNVPKDSPEYGALRKQLAEEGNKRQKSGVRKETGASEGAPIRYFDESTPRDRATDALYIYFVEISGSFWPRFCIQTISNNTLGITGFVISADGKYFNIPASSLNTEKTGKGMAQWYDMPLDRLSYSAVQAMIKAKKTTLTVKGTSQKVTRNVTENEIKGFKRILDAYSALGGSLGFLQGPPTNTKARP